MTPGQQQPAKRKRNNDANDGRNTVRPGLSDKNNEAKSKATDGDENIDAMFGRVVDRRRKEVEKMEPAFVRSLMLEIRSLTSTGIQFHMLPSSEAIDTEKAGNDIRDLIMNQYRIINDDDAPSNKRRRAWDVVNEIFRLIGTNGGTAREGIKCYQNKKVKYTGRNIAFADNTVAQSSTGANHTSVVSRLQGLTSDERNTTATKNTNDGTQKAAQKQSSFMKDKVRTVASLSKASASTTAHASSSSSSNDTIAVHPSMVGTSSTSIRDNNGEKDVPTGRGTSPPPYQRRSDTVLDHRNNNQNRLTNGVNSKNKNHQLINRSNSSSVKNKESNSVPVHPAMRQNDKTLNSVTEKNAAAKVSPMIIVGATNRNATTTTATTAAHTSKTSDAASAALPSSSSRSPTSLHQGTFSTTIPETVVSNNSNTNMDLVSLIKEKPVIESTVSTVVLPADNVSNNSFACYQGVRPFIKLQFNRYLPTQNMINELERRLMKWDPYWNIETMLCAGLTAPIQHRIYRNEDRNSKKDFIPNTAASFKIEHLLRMVGPKLSQVVQGQIVKDNELRVFLRMVPLDLLNEQSEKRADIHLWPTGTYLQININNIPGKATPQKLMQRKQQSHNYEKWLGLSHPLDVTSLLHISWSSYSTKNPNLCSVFELGCHDSEVYMFSLALCRYVSPAALTKSLLSTNNSALKRLTLKEAHDRATKLMTNNEVTLDNSDDEDEEKKEIRRIQFSLKDPLSMTQIKVPVRGRKCRHFSVRFCVFGQLSLHRLYVLLIFLFFFFIPKSHSYHLPCSMKCFDLGNYLEMNKTVSGQRWKCLRCELFLSYQDLEFCALTELGLERFGKKMTAEQHMVEYRGENRSMDLMPPVRTRQERTQAKKATNNNSNIISSTNQVSSGGEIEILEILSDSD